MARYAGFQHARASALAPFSYSQLVWSGLLGYVIFGNVPDRWTVVGAIVMIGSGLYTAQREHTVKVASSGPKDPSSTV